MVFDLLHLDGEPLIDLAYEERRRALDELGLDGDAWQSPAYHRGDGRAFRKATAERGLPGVVAKRLAGAYTPGRASRDWRALSYLDVVEVLLEERLGDADAPARRRGRGR